MVAPMPGSSWPSGFFEAATALLGNRFTRDSDVLEAYGRDWTKVFTAAPSAVAFTETTDEVAALLKLCHSFDVAVVPSGGRTGLAGGAVAAHGEVVLSLERMRRIDPVDPLARTVRCQAGAVTAAVHEHCAEAGLTWPVDFASAGQSQIGGNIATNAGGVRVVRYGLTRQWVLGLEVVTMAGDVLQLNGDLEKNNTGFDLRQLFIGSEGTLGIITAATLKLAPLPGASRVALLAVQDLRAGLSVFLSARQQVGFELLAFEYLTDECLQLVLKELGTPHPLPSPAPAYVLVEIEIPTATESEAAEAWLGELFERELVVDGVLGASVAQSEELWAYRERISETLSKTGFLHKNDVSVPVRRLADFVDDMHAEFTQRYPHFDIYFFGHVGDGNLHVNVMKPAEMPQADFLEQCHGTDQVLFELINRHRGSISAEHGIGLLKKEFLGYSRGPIELALFRSIKRAFDPKGLLNPGKVFDFAPGDHS